MSDLFRSWLWEEIERMKAVIRDDMPDWPYAFYNWPYLFASCQIPEWDEEVNPA